MQKTSKMRTEVSVAEVAAYEESIRNGMWEHLAGYALSDLDEMDEEEHT